MQDFELRVLMCSSSKREVRIMVLLGWVSVEARQVQSAFSHCLLPSAPTGAHPMPGAVQPSTDTAAFGGSIVLTLV